MPSEAEKADVWEKLFSADVRKLASEILVHICGESCYKYSGAKVEHICRHGFYYIVSLGTDWRRRRRGKSLRNALFIIKQTKFGMQGRVLHFQEHPFECQSNYAGSASLRSNLDVQDLRRVLPEEHWLDNDDKLPNLGERPEWGYMNFYEWDGEEYVPRCAGEGLDAQPTKWDDEMRPEDWRAILLECLNGEPDDDMESEDENLLKEMEGAATAAFSDGINTGFYINSYTTKHCPTMDGVLEEPRRGLERLLQQTRTEAQEKIKEQLRRTEEPFGC